MTNYMQMAIDEAARSEGGPFGAAIVLDDTPVGIGSNRVVCDCDPTAHAEIVAIRHACKLLGKPHLDGAILYASCEPCPLCLSAAYWAHVGEIVYAADREDAAKIGFADSFLYNELRKPLNSRMIRCYQTDQLLVRRARLIMSTWIGASY